LRASKLAEVSMLELSRCLRTPSRRVQREDRKTARTFERILPLIGEGGSLLFYDVFLITPQGEIIYTHKHEQDFATNLIDGPYRNSQWPRCSASHA